MNQDVSPIAIEHDQDELLENKGRKIVQKDSSKKRIINLYEEEVKKGENLYEA